MFLSYCTVINIPYFRYPPKELQTIVRNVKWILEIPFQQTNSCKEVQTYFLIFNNILEIITFFKDIINKNL